MTRPPLPIEGECRCGKVRLTVTQAPLLTTACHCTGCQRMTASAFSLTMMIPDDGLTVTGETVIGGIHGAQGQHHHCDWCKSWLFTRATPGMGFVNVRPTMFTPVPWFVPFAETYTSEKLPWATVPAQRSYAKFPDEGDFAQILKDFAAQA